MKAIDFRVTKDDPFVVYRHLLANAGPDVVDLSRGDPYNAPSTKADWVFNFFNMFALFLQEAVGDEDVGLVATAEDTAQAWSRAEQTFHSTADKKNVSADAHTALNELERALARYGIPYLPHEVLRRLGRGVQGASYGAVEGEQEVRSLLAHHLTQYLANHKNNFSFTFHPDEFILTLGASEAISALFELLSQVGYLKDGDRIAIISPVYGPYNVLLRKMNFEVVALQCHAQHGYEPTEEDLTKFAEQLAGVKLLALVNPSNPTGRAYSSATLARLGELVRQHDLLVIEDIVYYEFVGDDWPFYTLAQFAPTQSLIVGSTSKYYQAPGVRFGYLVVPEPANRHLSEKLGVGLANVYGNAITPHPDFRHAFTEAKAPDLFGVFTHTHQIPEPAQWLTLCRLILGGEDALAFDQELEHRWNTFYEGIGILSPSTVCRQKGLSPGFACYYCLVDFLKLAEDRAHRDSRYRHLATRMTQGALSPEQFLLGLAQAEVVGLPAALFFVEDPINNQWQVRFSVANQPLRRVKEAVERINTYLDRLTKEPLSENS